MKGWALRRQALISLSCLARSAGSAVDLMEASFSEAGTLSRGEARLRRRAMRALDSVLASEVLASMRSTAQWVGGSGRRVRNRPSFASRRYHEGK